MLEGMWLLNSYQYPEADLQALIWTLMRPEMHPAAGRGLGASHAARNCSSPGGKRG